MKKYVCTICGYVYDEEKGIPEAGVAPGTKWEDLPANWVCPLCGAAKSDFKEQAPEAAGSKQAVIIAEEDSMREVSLAEMSVICSNLAKGCEKQYLARESELFYQLADYYRQKAGVIADQKMQDLMDKVTGDLESGYAAAHAVADEKPDRGAKRALVWSEKVTRMLNSLMRRYETEKEQMLENTNIYVCEICGFIFIGDTPPAICPVCKVPNKKMTKVERG